MSTWMVASYLYYIRYESVMEDSAYDDICKRLLECYDDITHEHKRFVSKEDLQAGTGFTLRQKDYPRIVVIVAEDWMRDYDNMEEGL